MPQDSSTTDLPADRIESDGRAGPADLRFRVKSYPVDLAIDSAEGGIVESIVKRVQTSPEVPQGPDRGEGVIHEELKTGFSGRSKESVLQIFRAPLKGWHALTTRERRVSMLTNMPTPAAPVKACHPKKNARKIC